VFVVVVASGRAQEQALARYQAEHLGLLVVVIPSEWAFAPLAGVQLVLYVGKALPSKSSHPATVASGHALAPHALESVALSDIAERD
jgi:hypothetical protein